MDTTQRDAEPGSPPAGSDGLSVGSDGLSAALLASDPMTQFARWMEDAETLGLPEPTAMVLATVSAEGRPRARTVLLKGHDQSGFTFYSNRTSRKGQDLAANPRACVVFPAWASRQSQVIASRAELDDRVAELERRWAPPAAIPMPDFWGGYLMVPETVEFWQAGTFRLHDRLRYRRHDDGWTVERLSP